MTSGPERRAKGIAREQLQLFRPLASELAAALIEAADEADRIREDLLSRADR